IASANDSDDASTLQPRLPAGASIPGAAPVGPLEPPRHRRNTADVTAIRARVAAQMRGRLVSTLALTFAIAVASGTVLTSAVGARRTSTSLSRMMAAARTGDIAVSPALDPGAFRRLPEVVDAGRIT